MAFHCSLEINVERETFSFAQPLIDRMAAAVDADKLLCIQGLKDTLRMQARGISTFSAGRSSVADSKIARNSFSGLNPFRFRNGSSLILTAFFLASARVM